MNLSHAEIALVKASYRMENGDYKIYCDMPYPMPTGNEGLKRMIKCGVCSKCKSLARQQWTGRLLAENTGHENTTFATLTYAPEHEQITFEYSHIQNYLKRLRKKWLREHRTKIRFFAVGERGDKFGRIHWHLILFGHPPYGRELIQPDLEWPYGLRQYAPASPKTMSYVASYTLKKKRKQTTYTSRMSLRPGIGTRTMQRLARQMAASDTTWPKRQITVRFGRSTYPISPDQVLIMKKAFIEAGGTVPEDITPIIAHDIEAQTFPYWKNDAKELEFLRQTIYSDNKLPG